MKKILASALCLIFANSLLFAQIDEQLKEDIRNTGYVHSPLPLDYSKSFESFGLTKKVLVSDMLCDMESLEQMDAQRIWRYVSYFRKKYFRQKQFTTRCTNHQS